MKKSISFLYLYGFKVFNIYVLIRIFSALEKKFQSLSLIYLSLLKKKMERKDFFFLKKNTHLKDICSNKEVLITATGLSLRYLNKDFIRQRTIIAVNESFLWLSKHSINPQFLVLNDEIYVNDVKYNSFMEEILSIAQTSNSIIILPYTFKKKVEKNHPFFFKENIYYFSTYANLNFYYHSKKELEFNFSKPLPNFPTVSHTALALALYLGAKRIYLSGIDMDFILNPKTPIHHAYDQMKSHISKNCIQEYKESNGWDYQELLKQVLSHIQCFKLIKKVADHKKIKIINTSSRSFLDIFPHFEVKNEA